MSFVKFGSARAGTSKGGNLTAAKKRAKPRQKPWDDTISDLTVYKPTLEEIMLRKSAHQSKNRDLVEMDKLKAKINRAKAKESKNIHGDPLLREVLYEDRQLQDVLTQSEMALSVVKDLFGDDPKKYRGLPSVTVAPDCNDPNVLLPNGSAQGGLSKLDILSESMMDKSAINDLENYDDDDTPFSYQSHMDVSRFQQLLLAEQLKKQHEEQLQSQQINTHQLLKQAAHITQRHTKLETPTKDSDSLNTSLTDPIVAINDTAKVKRTQSRIQYNDRQNGTESRTVNLDTLKNVLDGIQNTLNTTSDKAKQRPENDASQSDISQSSDTAASTRTVDKQDAQDDNGFVGYTATLLETIAKLSAHLKQSELHLATEATMREHLYEDLQQQKTLIDALTNDLMTVQEEYAVLQMEFARYKSKSEDNFTAIFNALSQNGVTVHHQSNHRNGLAVNQQTVGSGTVQNSTGPTLATMLAHPKQMNSPADMKVQSRSQILDEQSMHYAQQLNNSEPTLVQRAEISNTVTNGMNNNTSGELHQSGNITSTTASSSVYTHDTHSTSLEDVLGVNKPYGAQMNIYGARSNGAHRNDMSTASKHFTSASTVEEIYTKRDINGAGTGAGSGDLDFSNNLDLAAAGVAPDVTGEALNSDLQQQIDELNHQHEEAKRKLMQLMNQQDQLGTAQGASLGVGMSLNSGVPQGSVRPVHNGMPLMSAFPEILQYDSSLSRVSPSISPIPPADSTTDTHDTQGVAVMSSRQYSTLLPQHPHAPPQYAPPQYAPPQYAQPLLQQAQQVQLANNPVGMGHRLIQHTGYGR